MESRKKEKYKIPVVYSCGKKFKTPRFETPDLCERLALSIPRRIQQVLHAKGQPTKSASCTMSIVNRLTALNNLNCCVVLCKGF